MDDVTEPTPFSSRLRAAMGAAGLSQKKTADLAKVSIGTIQNWLKVNGTTPTPQKQGAVLRKLAELEIGNALKQTQDPSVAPDPDKPIEQAARVFHEVFNPAFQKETDPDLTPPPPFPEPESVEPNQPEPAPEPEPQPVVPSAPPPPMTPPPVEPAHEEESSDGWVAFER